MNNGDGIVNHDTQFVGCQFFNGCIALYLQGKNMTLFNEGVLVENCLFENQQFKSIYLTFYHNVMLRGNTIVNANDFKTDYNSIDIFQCYDGAIIEKNENALQGRSRQVGAFRLDSILHRPVKPIPPRHHRREHPIRRHLRYFLYQHGRDRACDHQGRVAYESCHR